MTDKLTSEHDRANWISVECVSCNRLFQLKSIHPLWRMEARIFHKGRMTFEWISVEFVSWDGLLYLTTIHPLWKICRKNSSTRRYEIQMNNAAFRLACCSPHCRFDDDICTTAQAPLAAEGWRSGKQCLTNRSTTLPLCPPWQIANSLFLFNSMAMPLGDQAKVVWPLRAATLKQQAMITRCSGKAAS